MKSRASLRRAFGAVVALQRSNCLPVQFSASPWTRRSRSGRCSVAPRSGTLGRFLSVRQQPAIRRHMHVRTPPAASLSHLWSNPCSDRACQCAGLRFSGKNMSPLPAWLSGAQSVWYELPFNLSPLTLSIACTCCDFIPLVHLYLRLAFRGFTFDVLLAASTSATTTWRCRCILPSSTGQKGSY